MYVKIYKHWEQVGVVMGRKGWRVAAFAVGLLVMLSGGMASATAAQPLSVGPAVLRRAVKGSGKLKYAAGVSKLTSSQKKLLQEYMDAYYDSLADLDPVSLKPLYSTKAKKQRQADEAVLEALCSIRNLQKTDLRMDAYSYVLTVTGVTKQENGDILVYAEEDCEQTFVDYSTKAKSYNMGHSFLLTKTDGSWLLRDHWRMDSLTEAIRGQYKLNSGTSGVSKRVDTLLANAKKEVSKRKKRGTKPDEDAIQVDQEYNRKTAATYARKWVQGRNREGGWPDYGHWGGNCQNLVSQSLYASGIPMDIEKPGVWKWYGKNPDKSFAKQGRSPSWSGVNDFLLYVQANEGYGLVAHANAPYYSGQVGDIIHMGTGGQWKHTVMITKVIKNSDGDVIDYLVASNTADLRDFPASAHYYADQMLIKVYGWNEATSQKTEEASAQVEEEQQTEEELQQTEE